jgi:hypothetical protein
MLKILTPPQSESTKNVDFINEGFLYILKLKGAAMQYIL